MEIDKKLARILIVDDNVNEANLIYTMLRNLGYESSFVFSPEDAESMIRIIPKINIVLLDCFMPEMNGFDLAKKFHSSFKSSISVILMSGVVKKSNIRFFNTPNIHTMISKPLEDTQLNRIVKEILKKQFYDKSENTIFSLISEKILKTEEVSKKIEVLKRIEKEDLLLLFSYLFCSKSEGVLTLSKGKKFLKIYFYNGQIVHFEENDLREKSIQYLKKNDILSKEMSALSKIQSNLIFYTIKQSFLSPHHHVQFTVERILNGFEYFFNNDNFKIQFKNLKEESSQEDFNAGLGFDQKITLNEFSIHMNSFVDKNLSEEFLKEKFEKLQDLQLDLSSLRETSVKNSLFKNFNNKKNGTKDAIPIKEFIQQFQGESKVYTILYKALFFNMIKLSQNFYELKREENFYLERYSLLLKEFKTLDMRKIFEILGCKDTNKNSFVQATYKRFLSHNHIDSFFQYSDELKDEISEILKILNQSYNILSDKNKMEQYLKEKSQKESLKVVDFKDLENKFQVSLLEKDFDQVEKIIRKMKSVLKKLDGRSETLEARMELYEMCFFMKEKNYLLEDMQRNKFAIELVKTNKYIDMEDLFFYTRGCFEICRGDLKSAQSFLQKSLEKNSNFNLSKFEIINLKNKSRTSLSIFKKSS